VRSGRSERHVGSRFNLRTGGSVVSQALAALRLGYLSQKLRWVQDRIWSEHSLTTPDIEPALHELDQSLLGLSHRMNAFERSTVLALKERLVACHYEVSHLCSDLMLEVIKRPHQAHADAHRFWRASVTDHPATAGLKKLQIKHWTDLRTILVNVVVDDPRLRAWFEIGDVLGDTIKHGLEARLPHPLPTAHWAALYSGVDKLPESLRTHVMPLYPQSYRSSVHLACQLQETYQALCTLIQTRLEGPLMAVPHWDGVEIRYREKAARIRAQENRVITPILDEFQRRRWPQTISVSGYKGDVKQAVHRFSKLSVVRLSLSGEQVSWRDRSEL
jgi:hypothetical protein